MLQNEGLDEKKKTICDMCIRFYIPKEGEGGRLAGGICVGCEPICHFFKSIFWAINKFLLLFLIPGKPRLLVLLCKLDCFAVCWGFKLCLAIIYKLKKGEKGWKFWKYSQHKPNSSLSQILHPYFTFYTHFWQHCQASGFLLVCTYCLKF